MGSKMSVAFANICQHFHAKVETDTLSRNDTKPLVWKRFIDDIFSIWKVSTEEISKFIEKANKLHATIRFMADISEAETTFFYTTVYKGEGSIKDSLLDLHTHFKPKPTENFQYTHFTSCHPPGVKRGFVKRED